MAKTCSRFSSRSLWSPESLWLSANDIQELIDRYRIIQNPSPEPAPQPQPSSKFDPRPEDVRTAIRAKLDTLKDSRALNENKETVGVLRLVSGELACGEPGTGKTLSDHIATWLTTRREVRDLMRLARACGQLHQQGKQQEARQIGEVVNQALPLFLAQKVLADAWDKLENEAAVLIPTSLTKGTTAEILVAGLHHRPAEFAKGIHEPIGTHKTPYEGDPIGDPEWSVDSARRDLFVSAFHPEVKENERKASALEIRLSTDGIREELKYYYQALKDKNRMPCYCVVKLAATDADRQNQTRDFKDLGIPDLLFIGLFVRVDEMGFEALCHYLPQHAVRVRGERQASMSQARTGPKVNPPPEIDCSKAVVLVREGNRPEQYHEFEPESALAIRAALGARRPLLVRGKPGVGKTQLAAAAAKVLKRPLVSRSSIHGPKHVTCSGNSMR